MFSGVKGHKIIIIISSLLFERSISFAFLSCSFNFLKKKSCSFKTCIVMLIYKEKGAKSICKCQTEV